MSEFKPRDYTLENYAAIYDHYRTYTPDPKKIRFAGQLLRLLYNPQVSMADGAYEQASEHMANGHPVMYALNHIKVRDQFVVGSAIWSVPQFRHNLLQGVVIPAKPDYFTGISKLPIPTHLLEDVGMMPVFRATDAHGKNSALFKQSTEAYLETCAFQLSRGINLLVSPEGTRNTQDATKVQRLKQGVAKTALLACELGAHPMLLPAAVNYNKEHAGFYRPRVHIGDPIVPTGEENQVQLTNQLYAHLQRAVDFLNQ